MTLGARDDDHQYTCIHLLSRGSITRQMHASREKPCIPQKESLRPRHKTPWPCLRFHVEVLCGLVSDRDNVYYMTATIARPNQWYMFTARLPYFKKSFFPLFSLLKTCFGTETPGSDPLHKIMRYCFCYLTWLAFSSQYDQNGRSEFFVYQLSTCSCFSRTWSRRSHLMVPGTPLYGTRKWITWREQKLFRTDLSPSCSKRSQPFPRGLLWTG